MTFHKNLYLNLKRSCRRTVYFIPILVLMLPVAVPAQDVGRYNPSYIPNMPVRTSSASGMDMPYSSTRIVLYYNGWQEYFQGLLRLQNYADKKARAEAVEWLKKAAKYNNSDALYLLGKLAFEKDGIDATPEQGVRWLRQSANGNHHDAQLALSQLLLTASGIPHDPKEAFKWTKRAAQKDSDGQFQLGVLYELGVGTAPDPVKARGFFEQSAAQNNAYARFRLNRIAPHIAAPETPAHLGITPLDYQLLVINKLGWGVSAELQRAVEGVKSSAGAGDSEAQYILARMFREGAGVAVDAAAGQEWQAKAANGGHTAAQLDTGLALWTGTGGTQDYKLAMDWFTRSALRGNGQAQYLLGIIYRDGQNVKKDAQAAYIWFTLAKERGISGADVAQQICASALNPDELETANLALGFRRDKIRQSAAPPAVKTEVQESNQ